MSLSPNTWYEECRGCLGNGQTMERIAGMVASRPCPSCDGSGLIPHDHQPPEVELDEVARLQAEDDQLKADLTRDAEVLAYFRAELMDIGFSEEGAERIANTYYAASQYEEE